MLDLRRALVQTDWADETDRLVLRKQDRGRHCLYIRRRHCSSRVVLMNKLTQLKRTRSRSSCAAAGSSSRKGLTQNCPWVVHLQWIGLGQSADGLGWIGSQNGPKDNSGMIQLRRTGSHSSHTAAGSSSSLVDAMT